MSALYRFGSLTSCTTSTSITPSSLFTPTINNFNLNHSNFLLNNINKCDLKIGTIGIRNMSTFPAVTTPGSTFLNSSNQDIFGWAHNLNPDERIGILQDEFSLAYSTLPYETGLGVAADQSVAKFQSDNLAELNGTFPFEAASPEHSALMSHRYLATLAVTRAFVRLPFLCSMLKEGHSGEPNNPEDKDELPFAIFDNTGERIIHMFTSLEKLQIFAAQSGGRKIGGAVELQAPKIGSFFVNKDWISSFDYLCLDADIGKSPFGLVKIPASDTNLLLQGSLSLCIAQMLTHSLMLAHPELLQEEVQLLLDQDKNVYYTGNDPQNLFFNVFHGSYNATCVAQYLNSLHDKNSKGDLIEFQPASVSLGKLLTMMKKELPPNVVGLTLNRLPESLQLFAGRDAVNDLLDVVIR